MNVYYIKRKMISVKEKYLVYDKNKEPLLEIVGNGLVGYLNRMFRNIFPIGYRLNINTLNGEEKFVLKQKPSFLWVHYDLLVNNIICASIYEDKKFFKPKISISGQYGNYTIDLNLNSRVFNIIKSGRTVATIKAKVTSLQDLYEIYLYENEDDNYELFIALAIIIESTYKI